MAVAYDSARKSKQDDDRNERLLRQLKLEEQEALGYAQSEITGQQIDALRRYFGLAYGDEEDGRSQVVTREVMETIQWSLADMMRVFASGANILSLEETSEADAKYAKDAADYLAWIMLSDNRGFKLLHNFAFDGLLHRNGWIACYWRDQEYRAPQELTGLNMQQVMQLHADPGVEIIGQDFDEESEAGGITLEVRRVKSPARAEIVTIAPEDMRVNGRCPELEDARYIGRVLRMLRGEAARLWPDKEEEIEAYAAAAMDNASTRRAGDVRQVRFADNTVDVKQITDAGEAMEIEIMEEYLRVDLNEDGYPETIRCFRLGECILDESEVEENPFGTWSPIPVPHRLYGQSYDDTVNDLQRICTVLTRAGLDAVYQSVVNREAYDSTRVNLEDLLATYAGAKIAVDGVPGDAIMQLTGGLQTANVAWEALQQFQAVLENRTGSTRQTQGTDPDALLKGAHSGKAIDLLQTAGASRKELTSRHMGEGLENFLAKLYRMVCRNQNQPRQAKIGGKLSVYDPRTWNSDLKVRVHTGLGTGNREQTLMGLQMIGQLQQSVVEVLGPANPNVTMKNIYRLEEETCRAVGYHSAEPFFTEVPDQPVTDPQTGQPVMDPETGQPKTQPWTPPPPSDPEALKAQMQMKELEMTATIKQAEMQQANEHVVLQSQKDMALAKQQQEDEDRRTETQAAIDSVKLQQEQQKQAADAALQAQTLSLKEAELAQRAREFDMTTQLEMAKLRLEEKKLSHEAEQKDADRKSDEKIKTAPQDADNKRTDAIKELTAEVKKPRTVGRDKKSGKMTVS